MTNWRNNGNIASTDPIVSSTLAITSYKVIKEDEREGLTINDITSSAVYTESVVLNKDNIRLLKFSFILLFLE